MLYFAVAAIVVILDQASKRIIWEAYKQTGGTDLIDGFLRISLSKNAGAVLGILSGSRALLISVTILSVIILILFAHRMRFAPVSKRFCSYTALSATPGKRWKRRAPPAAMVGPIHSPRRGTTQGKDGYGPRTAHIPGLKTATARNNTSSSSMRRMAASVSMHSLAVRFPSFRGRGSRNRFAPVSLR